MYETIAGIASLLIAVGVASLIASLGDAFERKSKEISGDLKTRINRVVNNHPGGIGMVDVGRRLGIGWRKLIVPIRELLEEGKIDKKDRKYFPA